jgi:hypothetical protein
MSPQFKSSKPKVVDVAELDKFIHAKGWLRDRIIIHRQEGPGGIHAVFVQLNNFPVMIPREVECEVPKPIVQTLREAVATMSFRDEKGELFTRDITRYNMTVLQENVNWDDVMNDPEHSQKNIAYLKSIGMWSGDVTSDSVAVGT